MDATGAKALRRRMEEQQHWRQAEAVRDGRQPAVDPDGEALEEIGEGFRLYSFRTTSERRVRKSLVNGSWQNDGIVEPGALGDPSEGRGSDSPSGAGYEPQEDEAGTEESLSVEGQASLRRSDVSTSPKELPMFRRAAVKGRGRRSILARLRRDESGQSLVEFALVAPLLLLVLLGIFKFAITFNNYLTLTDAVRDGARQLAVERGQPQPCVDATNRVSSSATNLNGVVITTTFPAPDTSTCAGLVSGETAKVTGRYPCNLKIFGIDFAPGCTISASATERIE